jgi:hypothetical protein
MTCIPPGIKGGRNKKEKRKEQVFFVPRRVCLVYYCLSFSFVRRIPRAKLHLSRSVTRNRIRLHATKFNSTHPPIWVCGHLYHPYRNGFSCPPPPRPGVSLSTTNISADRTCPYRTRRVRPYMRYLCELSFLTAFTRICARVGVAKWRMWRIIHEYIVLPRTRTNGKQIYVNPIISPLIEECMHGLCLRFIWFSR